MHRLFKQNGITYKVVKRVKKEPENKQEERVEMTNIARQKLKQALRLGKKICFADETVFTKMALPRLTYSKKGQNINIDFGDMEKVYRSALAAISTDGKIEHLKVTERAINAKKYMSWLTKLRQKLGDDQFYLFVDNL